MSRREEARETRAEDWLLSRWASLSSRRYSSPFPKGSGVTRSGLPGWFDRSTQDSADKCIVSTIVNIQVSCLFSNKYSLFSGKYSLLSGKYRLISGKYGWRIRPTATGEQPPISSMAILVTITCTGKNSTHKCLKF